MDCISGIPARQTGSEKPTVEDHQPPVPTNGQTQEIVFQYVDNEKAIISVSNAAMSYGDNTYWYPEQEFAVTIPQITFTASFTKTYNITRVIERGFGYY